MNIDITAISQKLHIPPEVYRRILEKSVTTTAEDLLLLETAAANNDFDQLKLVSHRLKGVYSNLRIEELREAAERLQKAAETRVEPPRVLLLLQTLNERFEELKAVLSNNQ